MSHSECFLTRAIISPRTVAVRDLRDSYAWHQLVWKAFPGRDGEARDFLTRLDDKSEGTQLLVISPCEPARPEWLGSEDIWQTRPIPVGFFSRRNYRFQLRANPTVKRVVRDAKGARKKNGRREPVADPEQLRIWLERKGAACGFRICGDIETQFARQHFSKPPSSASAARGTLHSVDITGMLSVTDPQLFHLAVRNGIGSAKAFGFGLLVLSPSD
jgi:CRISPR system Cascade subunit CasE